MTTSIIFKRSQIQHHPFKPLKLPNLLTYNSKSLKLRDEFRWRGYFVREQYDTPKSFGVAVDASSSTSFKSLMFMSNDKLVDYIINPSLVAIEDTNMVEVSRDGVIRPYNLPDMSDLARTPRCVKLFFIWLLRNAAPSEIQRVVEIVMAGTSAQLPVVREEVELYNGVHDMLIKSYSNYFKMVHLYSEFTDEVRIEANISNITRDERDGRHMKLHIVAASREKHETHQPYKRARIKNPQAFVTAILWNCRGMARSAFPSILQHIIDCHNPDIFILSETRVSNLMCESVLGHWFNCRSYAAQPQGMGGGIVVMSMTTSVKVHVEHVSSNKWIGWVQLN